VKTENHTVRATASSRCRHHACVSGVSYAMLSAVRIDTMPVAALQSAARTPMDTSEPLAPATTSVSVLVSNDAASLGSIRVM
jgi:hypothetical protein